jgi:peptidoglycan hydrolase-like protein with peptidoglycan-binding domain
MKFSVSDELLREMFLLCSFIIPEDELVFVALRGVQPIQFGASDFRSAHDVMAVPVDYLHMRCTVVQWDTGKGKLALFVGSSVPHLSAVASHVSNNGNGVNRLASGYFGKVPSLPDHRYFKGSHGADRHLAFRNESKLPVWRTADDTDFEGDDRLEYEVVFDNLHCARQVNETAPKYSSFGCVVVAGKPGDGGASKITSELGPWKKFLQNAYGIDQQRFVLALFEENEALRTAEIGAGLRGPSVRFGSRGMLVEQLQKGLIAKGFNAGQPDGLFGNGTMMALRQFQLQVFGKGGTDLIAGAATGEALGIPWPSSGQELQSFLKPSSGVPAADAEPILSAHATSEPIVESALKPNPKLKIALDPTYKPFKEWAIKKQANVERWDVTIEGQANPIYLGYFFAYNGYPEGPTRGLARTRTAQPNVLFEPAEWMKFGYWPELLYPTAWAESNACYTVINAWDRAAMTFGFIQLAAHTGDDFLPFFRRLFDELPQEAKHWFPELGVVNGQLCFIEGNEYKSLENKVPAHDGGFSAGYYHGDLMAFFNPDRYHAKDKKPDLEELHAAGRWLAWTFASAAMRELQVDASIVNVKGSLMKLHQRMLANSAVKKKYPHGVDGMACDLLSVAVAAPHLSDGHIPMVLNALLTNDPIETIRKSNYGPGGRSQNVHDGMKQRKILKGLVYDLSLQKPV